MGNKQAITRITAIWALCESGLGGLLHATQIPFKGGVLCFLSILCISLICHFSDSPWKTMMKSLAVVLFIKAVISPHSSITAYLAVSFQGVCGAFLMSISKSLLSFYSFIILAYFETAIQKLLTLWLFFGNQFWVALDDFGNWILNLLHLSGSGVYVPVGIYFFVYSCFALLACWLIPGLVKDVKIESEKITDFEISHFSQNDMGRKRKRKKWIVPIVIGVAILFSAYFMQGIHSALYVFLRSLAVIYLWFVWVGPWLSRIFVGWIRTRGSNEQMQQIDAAISLFPAMLEILKINFQKCHNGDIDSWRKCLVISFAQMINYKVG